jgi:hypothetical protein
MRRSVRVLAVVAALAGGLMSVSTTSAAEPGKFPSEQCASTVAAAARLGTVRQVQCLDKKSDATTSDRAASAVSCELWYWVYNRMEACGLEEWTATTILVPSGEIIGQNYFQVQQNVRTSQLSKVWAHDVVFTSLGSWGVDVGDRLNAYQLCSGGCGSLAGGIDNAPLTLGVPIRGAGQVQGSVFLSGNVASGSSSWRFWIVTNSGSDLPPIVSPTAQTGWTPTIRCDLATPGTSSPGCVFPSFPPRLLVFQSSYPSYYKHIRDTQAWGVTNYLTRLVDPLAQTDNHSRACPGQYPRPAGFQCDEYPFASTREGAFTGGYLFGQTLAGCQVSWLAIRTSASGYSACMIPETENRDGGIDLQAFYLNNRVIDWDRFYVLPQ